MEQKFSKTTVDGLNIFRDLRDEMVESTFHAIYGSPLVQGRLRNLPTMMTAPAAARVVALRPGGSREGETSFEGTDCRG